VLIIVARTIANLAGSEDIQSALTMAMPSATSPAKPKAEPSQYMLRVHLAVELTKPGVQTKMSALSPLPPESV